MSGSYHGKLKLILPVITFLVCLSGMTQAKDFDGSTSEGNMYPSWFKETPFYDLAENLQEAKKKGKQGLMLVFGTKGCSYCSVFVKKSLGDPELASIVKKHFDSIGLEIFDDTEMVSPGNQSMSIKQFAKESGVQFSPTLLFFDTSGKRVLRVVGYQSPERFKKILGYVTNNHYRFETLKQHFSHHVKSKPATQATSAILRKDSLFTRPPYSLQQRHFPASQPLLVLFEKADCGECNDFHNNVLSQKEVRNSLKKFEIIRLDITDNKTHVRVPNGRLTTPAQWFNQTGFSRLPALVFFSVQGEKVLETDALVKRQRMMNAVNYVLERAYEKNWTYQQFARTKALERNRRTGAERN